MARVGAQVALADPGRGVDVQRAAAGSGGIGADKHIVLKAEQLGGDDSSDRMRLGIGLRHLPAQGFGGPPGHIAQQSRRCLIADHAQLGKDRVLGGLGDVGVQIGQRPGQQARRVGHRQTVADDRRRSQPSPNKDNEKDNLQCAFDKFHRLSPLAPRWKMGMGAQSSSNALRVPQSVAGGEQVKL